MSPATAERLEVCDVFPALDAGEIRERVERAWHLADGFVPLPRWPVRCPAETGSTHPVAEADPHAGGYRVQLSRLHYGRRKAPATLQGRVDVVFKCTACSLCWTHGVPVPVEVYERATREHGNTWRWREILEHLGGREALNLTTER